MKQPSLPLALFLVLAALCVAQEGVCDSPTRTLTLGAYTAPREAYGKAIIPAFQRYWKMKTGQEVRFQESYLGSGAQARAIAGGFEADVAALSLEADVDNIARAGLIRHDWRAGPTQGMVTRSVVVIAVRKGNPKGVRDWDDLRRKGLEVLTPNVRTSGGAKWNVCALYGAALRGGTGAAKGNAGAAEMLLRDVLRNVTVMDKGARESMINYERGVGDVAITYENEVLVGRKAGGTYEYVVPRATILIENPVAVVDKYADKHGNRDLAEAFVTFLAKREAQRAFAAYGLRPVDAGVAKEVAKQFPAVRDLFTIRDLGGWSQVDRGLFGASGAYERAMAAAR
ncbi:MAG TPA: sulfate ABC transporter substrate-binding protein [Thiobacillaceae bacterium]|nr:sulfate ABC transporter substrate-binding protein [Thiobacillaceae bacterium]